MPVTARMDDPENPDHETTVKNRHVKRVIAANSPEGAEGGPMLRQRGISMLMVGALAALILFGITMLMWTDQAELWWAVPLVAAGVLLFNPVMWAAYQRAREREQFIQQERVDPTRIHPDQDTGQPTLHRTQK